AETVRQSLKNGMPRTARSVFSDLVERIGGTPDLGSGSRLSEDLDLDSLSRVELLSALEDRCQIDLDEGAFTESATIGDIEKLMRPAITRPSELPLFTYPLWPLRLPVVWVRSAFYYLVVFPLTRLLCRAEIRGVEHLNSLEGSVLFASNHITHGDPALILSVLPRRFRHRMAIAMDGEMLAGFRHPPSETPFFSRILSFFKYWSVLTFFNAFPLPRLSGFRRSFAFAGEAMDRGFNVMIFPEGELTKDGKMHDFRAGVGLLAAGLRSPVVPVRIDGLWDLKKHGQRYYAPPRSVKVTFACPVFFRHGESPSDFAKRLEENMPK
ncbi:MAG: 1-acyl-sn-glycerol-3-phosphate acyltransferase, partial [Pyrinomonadaceae bacterium]